jgi:hypothetical protein
MASLDMIRRLEIQTSATGVDQTKASMGELAASTLTVQGALAKLAAQMEQTDRTQKAFNDNTKTLTDNSGSGWGSFAAKVALGAAAAALGIGALYTAFKVLYEIIVLVPNMLASAWALGNAKLAEYVALSEKAVASGVSTDFFQRITKSATDAKLPVDALTLALQKLATVTSDQLGGSAGQQRLNQLLTGSTSPLNDNGTLKAQTGNFQGNSGVAALANANTTEEKFKAITSLIDQAMQKGERLAALDVAKTFLGDAVAGNLAKDSDYLNKMLVSADKIKAEDLVPQSSVDNAVALQGRLDAAEKILSERWHPIQDILTAGGIAMKEAWVNIVENMAAAFDWAAKLMSKLGDAPSWFVQKMTDAATTINDWTTTPESRKAAEEYYGIQLVSPTEIAMKNARDKLGSGLGNPANISAATDQINSIQNKVFPDVSKDPAAAVTATKDAYDTAEQTLQKYVQTTNAAAASIDLSTGAQERAKAVATLTAAAIKDGLTPAMAAAKAEASGLADAAGNAAAALAKAQIDSQIKFGKDTSFLSAEDVAIATQLKGKYTDVATALGSVEASGIRTNTAMRGLSSTLETSLTTGLMDVFNRTKSIGQGAKAMSLLFVRALEEMIIKLEIIAPLMRSLQGGITVPGFNPIKGVTGSALGNIFDRGNVIPFAQGGVVDRPTIGPMALMGEAGPEAVVPLRRGSDGRLGIASAGGGSGGNQNISIGDIHVNVPEGTSVQNASAIGQAVKTSMVQVVREELSLQMRSRGMLNRAA